MKNLKCAQNNLGSSPINDVHDNQLGLDCENLNLEKTRDMFPSSQHQCLLDKVQVCRVARRGEGGGPPLGKNSHIFPLFFFGNVPELHWYIEVILSDTGVGLSENGNSELPS